MDGVARLEHEVAARDEDVLSPLDHGNEDAAVLRAQAVQPQGAERASGLDGVLDHFGAALGEGVDLGGRGEAQYAGNLRRRGLLGVEHQREAQLVLEEDHLLEILHRAHARDGVLDAELLAGEAAEHIDRVLVRDGNQQVRVGDAGLAEHGVVRAVAEQRHGVDGVGNLLKPLGVAVHNRDVVSLVGKAYGDLSAHASHAYKHYVHQIFLPLYFDLFVGFMPAQTAVFFLRLLRARLRGCAALAA